MSDERRSATQVVVVGGGPAGLLLSQLLDLAGVDSVVLEQRSREYVLSRVRAGVLEHGSTEVLQSAGVGERMLAERFVHDGAIIGVGGRAVRIDFAELTGRSVTIYGQTEVTKDLYDARDRRGGAVVCEADDVALHGLDGDTPWVTYTHQGEPHRIDCAYVAGCDGFHGVARPSIPAAVLRTYELVYPFGWLGILSETPPVHEELIYASHPDGFALASMRNPMLSRYYVQVGLDERIDDWPDDRFWTTLAQRLPADTAAQLVTGPSIEKSIAPLRSFVAEPMSYGRLFLAGDAAHIVPPTGAKGLNLAISDVTMLAHALTEQLRHGRGEALDGYSARALARVWKAVRFSWWMTMLLHRFPDDQGGMRPFLQRAELDYLATSRAAQTALAENYVGLALD